MNLYVLPDTIEKPMIFWWFQGGGGGGGGGGEKLINLLKFT